MGFKQMLQVHDEIVAEAPIRHAEECFDIMKYHMENAYSDRLTVKLEVEGSIGFNWEDCK